MKIIKPIKLPILTRVAERARRPELHVAAMLGFPLDAPRALLDELAFWAAVSAALGASGVVDEGFAKARGELLVAGSFFAPGGVPLPASHVRVKLGSVDKRLAIVGDRLWRNNAATTPEPMATMPLDWAHAFGGARFDRNPYGKGTEPLETDARATPLPNVDHYGAILRSPADRPEPAGFLPMDVTFAQRRARAGTYDTRWFEEHFPGLAPDAAPTFFNVAPEDQWIDGFFRGDEAFLVENMHPDRARIDGRLPGLAARAFVTQRTAEGERFVEIPLRWDTVWLFPSAGVGVVIAHGSFPVAEDDAADVLHLVFACEEPASPRPVEHYQQVLTRRLDKDKGAIAGLSDSDLMPPRASGVAPNLGEMDIGRWVRSEGLHAPNLRRGAERRRAEARARVEAEGLDPNDYGLTEPLPAPAPPPLDDLDALATYIEAESARADALRADAKAQVEKAREQARRTCADLGEDYDAMRAKALKKGGGPPRFSAKAHLETLHEAGMDAGKSRQAELERQEQSLRAMYRRSGHLQPTAAAMEPDAADRVRVLVQLAIDTQESLANRDFTSANLAGMRLHGVDLSGAFLEAADLSGCDLGGANLAGAVLAKANLRGADLTGARLRGANLGGAVLGDAVLERADLTDAVLSRAELAGARFAGATLTGADWLETTFGAVDLSGATLGQCNLIKADLRGARLAGADLSDANLIECSLDGADLSGARLEKTTFVTCKGEGVSFRGARLRQGIMVHGSSFVRADFSDADLERANLRGTALGGARFDRANLAGADLSECDATGASFERAILAGGLLIRAGLVDASLRGANLMDVLASKARLAGTDFRLHRREPVPGRPLARRRRREDDVRGGRGRAHPIPAQGRHAGRGWRRRVNREQLFDAIRHGQPVRGEDLSALDLTGADLSGATFEEVRFPRALRGAHIKESSLIGCDLSGCDAGGADLHLAAVYRSKLVGARLDRATVIAASFIECDAGSCSFAQVEAPIASWVKTSLQGASFAGANLDRANLIDIDATEASFAGANLEKATLYRADLRTADLAGTNLTLTTLIESKLGARSFAGIKLFRTQLMKSDLVGASFEGVDCPQCNFLGADLRGATFEGARGPQCFFGEAQLEGARFVNGDFRQAIFEKANLVKADLSGAVLEEACFARALAQEARFSNARLREADFSHADLTAADFSGASMFRTKLHATRRERAVLPRPATWLGDDEELARIEAWQPRHGAAR